MSPKTVRHQSIFFSADVKQIAGVSLTKAIEVIKQLGGRKDALGRWCVDARSLYAWYNNPCSSVNAGGGDIMQNIDRIVAEIRRCASGEHVSFSLFKRKQKPNYYIRIYRSDGRKEISLGTPDKKLAKVIEAEIRSRFMKASFEGIIPHSTREFFDEWLAVKEREIKLGSYKKYRVVLDKAISILPSEVHRVSRQHIEQYKQLLTRDGYAPKTIYEELSVLQAAFENARHLGYTNSNPVEAVQKPSKNALEPVEAYKPEEIEAIFTELERRATEPEGHRDVAAWRTYMELFYCMYYTGMRVSDARKLLWDEVSLHFGTMRFIQTKTGKDTIIRIPTPYIERLRALKPIAPAPGSLVYIGTTGKMVTYNSLDKAIRSVLQTCGLRKKSPIHSFRHTAAMKLIATPGMQPHEVANQLGDTVETIVRTYVKPVMPERAALDAAYMTGSPKGHPKLEDMEGFAVAHGTPELPPDPQIPRIATGILGSNQESSEPT